MTNQWVAEEPVTKNQWNFDDDIIDKSKTIRKAPKKPIVIRTIPVKKVNRVVKVYKELDIDSLCKGPVFRKVDDVIQEKKANVPIKTFGYDFDYHEKYNLEKQKVKMIHSIQAEEEFSSLPLAMIRYYDYVYEGILENSFKIGEETPMEALNRRNIRIGYYPYSIQPWKGPITGIHD